MFVCGGYGLVFGFEKGKGWRVAGGLAQAIAGFVLCTMFCGPVAFFRDRVQGFGPIAFLSAVHLFGHEINENAVDLGIAQFGFLNDKLI